jgi:hypothetical protein
MLGKDGAVLREMEEAVGDSARHHYSNTLYYTIPLISDKGIDGTAPFMTECE